MPSGRKPMSAALRLLRGNTNKGRVPTPPVYGAMDPKCPAELTDKVARAEWDRVAPDLARTKQVTAMERAVLMVYCQQYADWLRYTKRAAKDAKAQRQANQALALMLRAAAELGMTSTSRNRVAGVPGSGLSDDDAMAQLLDSDA